MSLVKSSSRQWQKPSTSIYEHTYGYGMNYYQPMIEYLDSKKIKDRKVEYPHLPYTNERGLDKYSPRKLIRSYTEADLHELSRQATDKAAEDLRNLKIHKQSGYSLQKTVSSAAVQQVRVEAVVKKTKKRKQKKVAEEQMSRVKEFDYDPDIDKQAEWSLKKIKRYLQGKSANAIEQVLLRDSEHNMNKQKAAEEMGSFHGGHSSMSMQYNTRVHSKMMDARMTQQLNESFTEPLDNLQKELKGFNRKNTVLMENQR